MGMWNVKHHVLFKVMLIMINQMGQQNDVRCKRWNDAKFVFTSQDVLQIIVCD